MQLSHPVSNARPGPYMSGMILKPLMGFAHQKVETVIDVEDAGEVVSGGQEHGKESHHIRLAGFFEQYSVRCRFLEMLGLQHGLC